MSSSFESEEIYSLDFMVFGKGGKSFWNSPEDSVQLINSTECKKIFCAFLDDNASNDDAPHDSIEKSVRLYLEHAPSDKKLFVANIGVASLQLFVQSNWIGPPLPVDLTFPWITERLSERLSDSKVVEILILDGESCSSTMRHPLLLLLAREALLVCAQCSPEVPGIRWWWQRCMFIHQQVLDEFSVSLHDTLMTLLKEMLGGNHTALHDESWSLYHLEAAQIYLYYSQVVPAREQLDAAAQKCKLDMELMGALGKRTKFQEKAVAQLMLKVSVDRKDTLSSARPEFLPKDLSLNDEVRLNKIHFLDESDGKFPHLTPLEQAVVLGTFVYTQKSQPKDKLSEEELLPYLSCILANPQSWSLQMAALLFRCRLESKASRTVERSMMQAQELVDCLEAAQPNVEIRALTLFVSYLPPHWRIQADLANLLLSLGSVKSALDIYLQLDLWEDVINCYNLLQQRHLAAEIIREKLNAGETVKLWCLLGDATDDVSCYERAWELSKHKSGRAQRHWALYYFRRKCYAESIPHFQASLVVNSLQVTMWFQFGFACLDQEKWELCATAYRRYCTLDPENFEAWNNLAKAYAKMGQKARAWKALQEAVKCNYENWQVWDNLLVVSTDCGEFEEVIHSYHRILDLKKRHLDLEVLKILVNAVSKDLPDNRGIPAGRHLKNALALFGRLTGQITNNSELWRLYAQLTSNIQEQTLEMLQKTVQYLQKAHRCAVQNQHWARDVEQCKSVVDLCIKLADACTECCKNCASSNEAVQILTSAKLSIKGVLSKIKQEQMDILTETVVEELTSSVAQLEEKFLHVVQEIQHLQN